jgi:hypothetical protein
VLSRDEKATLRHVQLTLSEMQILEMICDRGGEVPWDWSKLTPAARDTVTSMINRGILIEREHVTDARAAHGVLHLRATDLGRAVCDQIKAMRVDAQKISASSGMSSPAEEPTKG